MNKMNKIINKINNVTSKAGLQLKKRSPEIFIGLGVIGAVGSTVLACRATLKINDILGEKEATVEAIHKAAKEMPEKYSEKDKQKDLTILYTQTGVYLVKLYLPSAILGVLSLSSIIHGYKILNKRNAALIAAYAAVDNGFKKYRANVVDRFGEEIDHELRYNIKAKEIEKTTVDKNGKEKKSKEIVFEIQDPNKDISDYAKFFDEESDQYKKDPEYNLMFLRRQQDYANDTLKNKGYLFLNEVYDMLGIPRTKAGQIVGWIYDKKNPQGDNFVDFGIYSPSKEGNRRFVDGYETSILLDFNVDGVIYDKI